MIQGINAKEISLSCQNSSDKVSHVRAIESSCGFILFMYCAVQRY